MPHRKGKKDNPYGLPLRGVSDRRDQILYSIAVNAYLESFQDVGLLPLQVKQIILGLWKERGFLPVFELTPLILKAQLKEDSLRKQTIIDDLAQQSKTRDKLSGFLQQPDMPLAVGLADWYALATGRSVHFLMADVHNMKGANEHVKSLLATRDQKNIADMPEDAGHAEVDSLVYAMVNIAHRELEKAASENGRVLAMRAGGDEFMFIVIGAENNAAIEEAKLETYVQIEELVAYAGMRDIDHTKKDEKLKGVYLILSSQSLNDTSKDGRDIFDYFTQGIPATKANFVEERQKIRAAHIASADTQKIITDMIKDWENQSLEAINTYLQTLDAQQREHVESLFLEAIYNEKSRKYESALAFIEDLRAGKIFAEISPPRDLDQSTLLSWMNDTHAVPKNLYESRDDVYRTKFDRYMESLGIHKNDLDKNVLLRALGKTIVKDPASGLRTIEGLFDDLARWLGNIKGSFMQQLKSNTALMRVAGDVPVDFEPRMPVLTIGMANLSALNKYFSYQHADLVIATLAKIITEEVQKAGLPEWVIENTCHKGGATILVPLPTYENILAENAGLTHTTSTAEVVETLRQRIEDRFAREVKDKSMAHFFASHDLPVKNEPGGDFDPCATFNTLPAVRKEGAKGLSIAIIVTDIDGTERIGKQISKGMNRLQEYVTKGGSNGRG